MIETKERKIPQEVSKTFRRKEQTKGKLHTMDHSLAPTDQDHSGGASYYDFLEKNPNSTQPIEETMEELRTRVDRLEDETTRKRGPTYTITSREDGDPETKKTGSRRRTHVVTVQ